MCSNRQRFAPLRSERLGDEDAARISRAAMSDRRERFSKGCFQLSKSSSQVADKVGVQVRFEVGAFWFFLVTDGAKVRVCLLLGCFFLVILI